MGQSAGDCKVVIKDQQHGPLEQQPTGFHTQLNSLDHSQLLPQAGAKPNECPSLPSLTIDDQQANTNALRRTDGAASFGSNAIQSTYEALDLDVRPASGTEPQTNAQALRPAETGFANAVTSVMDGPGIQSTYETLDQDVKPWRPEAGCPVNPEQPNRNELIIPDENQNQDKIRARLALQSPDTAQTPVNPEIIR